MFATAHPGGTNSVKVLKWSAFPTVNVLHCPSFRVVQGLAGPEPPLAQAMGKPVPPAGSVCLQMVIVFGVHAGRSAAIMPSTTARATDLFMVVSPVHCRTAHSDGPRDRS